METEARLRARDGVTLGYRVSRIEGARHTLVLLNGLASNLTRWSEFLRDSRLARVWNTLRTDRRGHAGSMYRGRISRPIWVTDLDEVLAHEGFSPVVLLGHSLGTEVALDYAHTHPERVEALVLIDPVFPQNLTGYMGVLRRFRYLLWLPILLLWGLNALGFKRRRFPPRDMYLEDRAARETLVAHPGMKIADLYMNPFADLPYLPLANYLQDVYEAVRPLPPLEAIGQPVLVVLSSGSSVSDKAKNQAQIARFADAHIEWVDCDHWPLTEKPDEVRELVDNWCLTRLADQGIK